MARSRATPNAKRVKISVTGEISSSAALVATKEMPQKTMAARTPARGGAAYTPSMSAAASSGTRISWWPVRLYPRPTPSVGRCTTFVLGR
jgi:hypothetical protein